MKEQTPLAVIKAAMKAKQSGYMIIEIGYTKVCVPYRAGVQIVQALENAEIIEIPYQSPCKFTPMQGQTTVTPIHENEYMSCKLSHVMNIPITEARNIIAGGTNE